MTTYTDGDLERLLRTTLDSRAATVSIGPAWTGAPDRRPHRRWIAPLVAAALVVALVGAYLLAHPHRRTSPASTRPDFTTFDVVGYPVTSRSTYPDMREVVVHTPHGSPGGDVVVSVYARGKYQPAPLQHRRAVTISGHRGSAGVDGDELHRHKTRPIREVVWQFAPQQWVVVQQMGMLERVPTAAELLAVARATRPGTHVEQTTPVRFTALPAGTHFDHVELTASNGVLFMEIYRGGQQAFQVTVGPSGDPSDTGGDVTLRHGGAQLDIVSAKLHGGPSAADRKAMRFLARHVVWDTTDLRLLVP